MIILRDVIFNKEAVRNWDKKIEDIILVPLRLDEVECETQTESEIMSEI